jgi:6-phosphofructokinase 1
LIGTSRANPGKDVSHPSHFEDPERTAMLRRVHQALDSLDVDALVSIGGDDTLKTANKFKRYQEYLPSEARRIAVVHVPKTIDNDYRGIDFTFGYFTAVEFLASEIRNLLADAEAGRMYFLVETMGRSAGWLAYGAAIAGEASLVLSVEDLSNDLMTEESITDPATGVTTSRKAMNTGKLVDMIVRAMIAREQEGKEFGVIVLAEGLAQFMPSKYLEGVKFDEHGNISLSQTNLARNMMKLVEAEYERRTRKKRRVTGLQLGYEARCARLRRHSGKPTRGRCLPRSGRKPSRRRARLGLRPVEPQLRPVRGTCRPSDSRNCRPLHPEGERLSAAGPVLGELSARLTSCIGDQVVCGCLRKLPCDYPSRQLAEARGFTLHQ